MLVEASDEYTANETEIFFLDLFFGISPFPPYVISRWTLDNEDIGDSAIILGDYNISIDPVDRKFSGKVFKLTVSNDFGMDNANFTLNVQCKCIKTIFILFIAAVKSIIQISSLNQIVICVLYEYCYTYAANSIILLDSCNYRCSRRRQTGSFNTICINWR